MSPEARSRDPDLRNDVDEWLAWFAGIRLEAQRRTRAQIEFLIDKSKLLDRLRGDLNERQEKVLRPVAAVTLDDAGNVVLGGAGLTNRVAE